MVLESNGVLQKVEGGDISDLLTRQSQMEGNLQQMLTQPRVSESDVQIAEQQLRTLLLAGRKKVRHVTGIAEPN